MSYPLREGKSLICKVFRDTSRNLSKIYDYSNIAEVNTCKTFERYWKQKLFKKLSTAKLPNPANSSIPFFYTISIKQFLDFSQISQLVFRKKIKMRKEIDEKLSLLHKRLKKKLLNLRAELI